MNRVIIFLLVAGIFSGCTGNGKHNKRIPVAKAGNTTLYFDEIPQQVRDALVQNDSAALIMNYINKWARRELLYNKAESNLSPELMNKINQQLEETRHNLIVYEYQRMMMLEKMDTTITEIELKEYYDTNQNNFILPTNIVKALFLRIPSETPNIWKIRSLARSKNPNDFQELESLCFQFAEKFDDFHDSWITPDRLSSELDGDNPITEGFLKSSNFYEKNNSTSISMIVINDYRLRNTVAPYEYVRDDIKKLIWNNRRIQFLQSLETGIYNEAQQNNRFKIF